MWPCSIGLNLGLDRRLLIYGVSAPRLDQGAGLLQPALLTSGARSSPSPFGKAIMICRLATEDKVRIRKGILAIRSSAWGQMQSPLNEMNESSTTKDTVTNPRLGAKIRWKEDRRYVFVSTSHILSKLDAIRTWKLDAVLTVIAIARLPFGNAPGQIVLR